MEAVQILFAVCLMQRCACHQGGGLRRRPHSSERHGANGHKYEKVRAAVRHT